MLAQEIIRHKRDGAALDGPQIAAFVRGLVDGSWSEGQVAAMAMALYLRGMLPAETVALTQAMTESGTRLQGAWRDLPGPVLDKHSTGGVGDKVSLMLAPIVAACGGYVPMISGRGLGHTGGTLDKLDSIPGYRSQASLDELKAALCHAGCAIVGQTEALAPADRRLYAVRDVTATVESIPLITASILSKKLAAGLQGLVMDVKVGNGAFAASDDMARELAQSIVAVAQGAGLPTRAWITDMNQVLGHSCGNALEVREALRFLRGGARGGASAPGEAREPRLLQVTRQLAAELLCLSRLAGDEAEAFRRIDDALDSGRALECFAKMVAALGGPADLAEAGERHLQQAPVQRPVHASCNGYVTAMDTREFGLAVVELGGGRRRASDRVDPRVGIDGVLPLGRAVRRGEPLATVHAADDNAAQAACERLLRAIEIGEAAPTLLPVLRERIVA